MPVVDIEVIEGVFDDAQKANTFEKMAKAMVEVEGEGAQNIRLHPDGSIDFDHYERIARGLRACDQRAALALLATPIARFLRAFGSTPSAQIRAPFKS
jgi:4-oxalocrotonate tautomerase